MYELVHNGCKNNYRFKQKALIKMLTKGSKNDKVRLSQFDHENFQRQCYSSNQIFIADNLFEPETLIINVERWTGRQTNIADV